MTPSYKKHTKCWSSVQKSIAGEHQWVMYTLVSGGHPVKCIKKNKNVFNLDRVWKG